MNQNSPSAPRSDTPNPDKTPLPGEQTQVDTSSMTLEQLENAAAESMSSGEQADGHYASGTIS